MIGAERILHQSSGENIGITIIPTQQCFGLDYMTVIQQFSRSAHDQVVLPVICVQKGSNAVIEGKQGDRNKGANNKEKHKKLLLTCQCLQALSLGNLSLTWSSINTGCSREK